MRACAWRSLLRACVATAALAGTADPAASAAVDLNGLWRVGVFANQGSLSLDDVCSLTIVQTAQTLSMTGTCDGAANPVSIAGSVDPASGSFTGSGSTGVCPTITIDGNAAADSATFTGSFSCPQLAATGGVNANRCGNGQIDAGETCDDGNLVDGDCCSWNCQSAAAGTGCTSDDNPCTTDVCSAAGECQHLPSSGACNDGNPCTSGDACSGGQCVGAAAPDDAPCDDGNACTSGDRCVAGACTAEPTSCPRCLSCNVTQGCVPTMANRCKELADSTLVLKSASTDAVTWNWKRGDATTLAELGNPTTTTDYGLCIYDGSAGLQGFPGLLASAPAPAGARWRPRSDGFAYKSRNRAADGIGRVRLSAGPAGAASVRLRGRGSSLDLPPVAAMVFPITVQLKSENGAQGECWSARYDSPASLSLRRLKAERTLPRPDRRPNILVIQLDDTRSDGIDRMPTLAQLAAEGVSFSNSFVVNSLCAPSRASLLTGLQARHHGVRRVGGGAQIFRERGSDRQTVAVWLQAAGYLTGLFGKYVNGYGTGATEQTAGPGGSYYVPPGWSTWRGMVSPEHYGGMRGPTYALVDEQGVVTAYADHASDRQYSTDLLGAELRTFIAAAVGKGQPFLGVWAPYASHVDLPAFLPNPAMRHFLFFNKLEPWHPASWSELDLSDKPRWMQGLVSAMPGDQLDLYNEGAREGAYESLLAVDEQLRLIRDQLVELGVDGNTVVIVTSDNGVGWGEHRLFLQGKECPYEECLRVPMIARDPRVAAQGIVADVPVLNVDVAPTVAELAGVTPPVDTDGASFAPWISGQPPPQWRGDFLLEHWRGTSTDSVRYTGQVTDGDQLRVLYGDPRTTPRASALFEFDSGDGVAAGALPVGIGASDDASFAALGNAIKAAVPLTSASLFAANDRLSVSDISPNDDGVYLVVERDQGGVMRHADVLANYFGVRDLANAFTYVEHESGEIELYDLTLDPAQLQNKAGDPAYAVTQSRLAARLDELLD